MGRNQNEYIPALGYGWLTSLYDPLLRLALRESTFKPQLVRQARIEPGHRVLDLGCGTGTLTLLLKTTHPDAEVVGLDGDPKVLEIAKAKAAKASVEVRLDHGMAFDLPYSDSSFDCVLSSLLLHHLTQENKVRSLKEAVRVLRPGGELHVADWGKPRNAFMRMAFVLVQVLDSFETTDDNVKDKLPILFADAGFVQVQEMACYATIFGDLYLYEARKAGTRRTADHLT